MDTFAQFFDIVLHLDQYLPLWAEQYGTWIYVILFMVIFCETGLVVMPFLPGDSLLFVAGAVAALGKMDITTLSVSLFIAAVLGDNLNYWVGRSVGKKVFAWENSRFFNRAAFDKAHAYFEKHGGKAIIIARFIPLLRTFTPFTAGVAAMTYRRFFLLDVLGGAIWIFSLTLAGYFFGNVEFIKKNLTAVILLIIAVSLLPVIVAAWKSRTKPAV